MRLKRRNPKTAGRLVLSADRRKPMGFGFRETFAFLGMSLAHKAIEVS